MKAKLVRNEHDPDRWDVYNAEGQRRGWGLKLEDAQHKAIFINHPEYYPVWSALFKRLFQIFPHALEKPDHERRMFRALQLLEAGAVSPNGFPHQYYVQSQSHPNIKYLVTIGRDRWKCVMVDHPNASKKAEYCPDIASGQAPDFGHGPRCKHMIATQWYHQLHPPTEKAPAVPAAEAPQQDPEVQPLPQSTTTSEKAPISARYADGRPARRADGTVIRYTAGGSAVELPPGCKGV